MKRVLDDVARVIEEGGEITVDDPDIRIFMQSERTGVMLMVYTTVWERGEISMKSVTRDIKAEMLIDCTNCDCMLIFDPLKKVVSWTFNVRAPFKIKSVQMGRWGQKAVRLDIIKL